MRTNSKIFVAGHRGLVGSAIVRKLDELGYTSVYGAPRDTIDLRNQRQVETFFHANRPEYVFLAAAKVGGIYANDTYSADFIYDNLMIQSNVIEAAYRNGCKKLLFMGSVCIYPKYAPFPVKEESILTGHLEPTNEAYAIAKISGIKMCQAYNKQHGFKCVTVMPANLYGPNDNFHPDNGHVIPAMFTKFERAETGPVTFWGDGTPYREFLYADDMADACIFLMNNPQCENGEIVNIGSGDDISIKDLSVLVADVVGFKGEIRWDTSKPNGTPRRPLDFTKIKEMGWMPKYNLKAGLEKTHQWYKENREKIVWKR